MIHRLKDDPEIKGLGSDNAEHPDVGDDVKGQPDDREISGWATGWHNLNTIVELAVVAEEDSDQLTCEYATERWAWAHISKDKKDKKVSIPYEKKLKEMVDFICACEKGKKNGETWEISEEIKNDAWFDKESLIINAKITCNKCKVSGSVSIEFFD